MSAKRIPPSDEHPPEANNVVALPQRSSGLVETDGDEILLTRVAAGDQGAFRETMVRHLSPVLATARRIVRDDAEAEDIAQEVFLRLWNSAASLQAGEYGLRPWLRRVASNLAIDWLRKSKRLDVTDDLPEQAGPAVQLATLEALEVSGRIERALSNLPPRQRIAVSLFHFDGMSQREVADMMELTEDALESLLARGRRRLKELLKDDWQEMLLSSGDTQ
ncbi:MAG: sigma-70 family RNA polymerase sigma factor [Alphaproteobacteria bacterium]|nr:sigma-70 family RNA polymerase sigma factor [Alphaproteobacteria bacterium]